MIDTYAYFDLQGIVIMLLVLVVVLLLIGLLLPVDKKDL